VLPSFEVAACLIFDSNPTKLTWITAVGMPLGAYDHMPPGLIRFSLKNNNSACCINLRFPIKPFLTYQVFRG
jgi:hypothetical protein